MNNLSTTYKQKFEEFEHRFIIQGKHLIKSRNKYEFKK